MIARRELLAGAACLCAVAASEVMRPRRVFKLMPSEGLDAIVPSRFGAWSSTAADDLVVPEEADSLASRLYADRLTRLYRNTATGQEVMLLVAYGASQTDTLQLHRPESCYPAVGFTIGERRVFQLAVGAARLPAVALTATAPGRTEDILYWTRLGDALPTTAGEQRRDRLASAMDGLIPDGALVRASAIRRAGGTVEPALADFLQSLLLATPPSVRPALVGTPVARAIA